MNKKTKSIIITVAVTVLVVAVAIAAIFASSKGLGATGDSKSETTTQAAPVDNTVRVKPEKVAGVVLNKQDLPDLSAVTADEAKAAIDTVIADIGTKGFNTVFLEAFSSADASVKCTDASLDVLDYITTKLTESKMYISFIFDAKGEYADSSKELETLLSKYKFGAVVFGGDMAKENNFKLAAADVNAKNAKVSVAVCASSENAEALSQFLRKESEDFFVSIPLDIDGAVKNYVEETKKLNDFSVQNGFDFISGIRADLIEKEFKDNKKATAVIVEQLSIAESIEGLKGTAIFNYSEFKAENAVGAAILKYMTDKQSEETARKFELKNFSSTKKTTEESKITFTGSSSPLYELTLNGKAVEREANGDFSFETKLTKGENVFKFEHKEKAYTYVVTYRAELIKSVTPVGSMDVPGDSIVTISAVALRGSSVYAVVNGKRVNLSKTSDVVPSESGNVVDESSDFAVYKGKYKVPASKSFEQSLGRIKVYAVYNGMSASLTGANLTINAELPAPHIPDAGGEVVTPGAPFDPSKMLTPYKYAGVSGKSKMCEVISVGETLPKNVVDDYVPYSSPLVPGTFDYVISEFTFGPRQFLKLGSGRSVRKDSVKIIPSGYNLPRNNVSVVGTKSNSEHTEIKFGLTWKVPFNVAVKNQNYIPHSEAYGGSYHSVRSFDGKYIDITFSYTGTAVGNVNVQGSRVISAAKWSTNKNDNTVNLRLTLKNPGRFYGYTVRYTSDGCLTLSIKAKTAYALSGTRIVVDPGHGGSDSGATCAYSPNSSSKYEKQLNLLIANKLKAKLEAQGATVYMTRTSDTYSSIDQRRDYTRKKNPDLFISVHCDSSPSTGPMGTTAFYYQAYSQPFALSIHKRIVSTYKNSIYAGYSADFLKRVDRGTNMYPFLVTRIEECPAILVEYGFVSNMAECKILWKSSTQDKLAQATVDGIKDYLAKY